MPRSQKALWGDYFVLIWELRGREINIFEYLGFPRYELYLPYLCLAQLHRC